MKKTILSPIIRLALPTLVRHILAVIAGALAISPDADIGTYVVAAVAWLLAWVWSLIDRDALNAPDRKALIAQISRATASQVMPLISGVLIENGFTGDPNDTTAVAIFAANYAHSLSMRNAPPEERDVTPQELKPAQPEQPAQLSQPKRRNIFRR